MVRRQHKPLNPYIAGSALDGPVGFFGRDDILRLVETELRSPHQNAIVLFGQRRIGKTSILLQLRRRLPESGFVPVYLDLMDRARRPLGAVLAELADKAALKLGLDPPEPERYDDEGRHFRQGFLPAVYEALGEDEATRRLVFLFDEFDVLDVAAAEELPETAAAWAFFPYLRELMAEEKPLGFVIVVGRKTKELSTDFRATFRAARYQKVSVLAEEDARALIGLAERGGSLRYTSHAVARILALTAGHPFFTQLTCFFLFNRAWAGEVEGVSFDQAQGAPQVNKADVDAAVPSVLEAGNNAFEWVWDGLPPAERVIFSAIAEGTDEQSVLNEDQILEVLQEHGIRILIRELELAPRTLVGWEMLRRVNGGYRFFIELMRRWVARHKPLARVRDDLDRIVPLADQLYQVGHAFYQQGDLEAAMAQLRQAVTINPNHLKARLLLGVCLREQGDLAEAVEEFEWAYEYDPRAAHDGLVRTLFQRGEFLEKGNAGEEALAVYQRVLEVSPHEAMARERRRAIYLGRAVAAEEAGDWQVALESYEWLTSQNPDDPRWKKASIRLEQQSEGSFLGSLSVRVWGVGTLVAMLAIFLGFWMVNSFYFHPRDATRQARTAAQDATATAEMVAQAMAAQRTALAQMATATAQAATATAQATIKPTDTPTPTLPPPVSTPSTVSALNAFGYGLQAHMIGVGHDDTVTGLKDLGFQWLKQQIDWEKFEPEKGQYDWVEIDRLVDTSQRNDIHLLLSVVKAPDWARGPHPDSFVEGPPADPQDLAVFLGAMAARYRGRVHAYEIWNEQNLHYEWGNEQIDAGRYVRLLAAAYNAIKSADPQAFVISGALTPAGTVPGPDGRLLAVEDATYLRQMYQAGLKDYCDGVGAHPSGYNIPPDVDWRTYQDPAAQFRGLWDTPHYSWSFLGVLETYRQIMVEYGDGGKLLWVTEFGWAVEPDPPGGREYAADNTLDEQRDWTVKAFQMGKSWGWVGPMFLWNLNFRQIVPWSEQAMWSIIEYDGTPLPVYIALRDMPK